MGRESDFTQQPNNLRAETLQSAFIYNQWGNFSRKQSFIVIITIVYTFFFFKYQEQQQALQRLDANTEKCRLERVKVTLKVVVKIPIAAIFLFFSLTKEPILYVFFGYRFMFQYVQRISLFKRSIYCNFFVAFAAQMGRKKT